MTESSVNLYFTIKEGLSDVVCNGDHTVCIDTNLQNQIH